MTLEKKARPLAEDESLGTCKIIGTTLIAHVTKNWIFFADSRLKMPFEITGDIIAPI